MKYCEEYAALLDLFVDGELTPEEMVHVQAHLKNCPGCQTYVDDALAMRAGFGDMEDTVVPEGFVEGVMERVRKDAGRGAKATELRRRSIWRWTGTLAALAACCALVIFVRTGFGTWNSGRDTAGITAASSGADAPAGDVGAGDEDGIAPQMAMEASEETGAATPEEEREQIVGQVETRMASMDREGLNHDTAKAFNNGDLPAAAPEAAEDTAGTEAGGCISLYLTAGEAGRLLDDYVPAWETAEEQVYELDAEEYQTLLEALGYSNEAAGEIFRVAVAKS